MTIVLFAYSSSEDCPSASVDTSLPAAPARKAEARGMQLLVVVNETSFTSSSTSEPSPSPGSNPSTSLAEMWNSCDYRKRIGQRQPRVVTERQKSLKDKRIGGNDFCRAWHPTLSHRRRCTFVGKFFVSRRHRVAYMGNPKVASSHLRRLMFALATGRHVKSDDELYGWEPAQSRPEGYFVFTFVQFDFQRRFGNAAREARLKYDHVLSEALVSMKAADDDVETQNSLNVHNLHMLSQNFILSQREEEGRPQKFDFIGEVSNMAHDLESLRIALQKWGVPRGDLDLAMDTHTVKNKTRSSSWRQRQGVLASVVNASPQATGAACMLEWAFIKCFGVSVPEECNNSSSGASKLEMNLESEGIVH
eukprot:CAMPEP_0197523400 /NCGR_PEP_ID=MMETSP1318-20131121/8336_1 /TAXON_ID=552666 /ORGANISM="Partenskyella glossopodia, Strain RCC365" /LENGTH=362 /DNA_ID=CAMNT_0043076079 /DNA_START=89 /DNA_END=1177 /DNA_ORIENTATION=+